MRAMQTVRKLPIAAPKRKTTAEGKSAAETFVSIIVYRNGSRCLSRSIGLQHRHDGIELGRRARLGADLAQDTGLRSFDLDVDLVGFDFQQGLSLFDSFTLASEPAEDLHLIALVARSQTRYNDIYLHCSRCRS